MALNSLPSIPSTGMNLDLSTYNSGGKVFPYALNASIEDFSGNEFHLQNDSSNLLAVNFPAGFQVVGKVEIHEQDRTIYALLNPTTGVSQIGEVLHCNYDDNTDDKSTLTPCDNCLTVQQIPAAGLETIAQTPYCQYYSIIPSGCLNFSLDYNVDIEYRITDCGLNVYLTDNLNERRFVYFLYEDQSQRGRLLLDDRFKVVTGFTDGDCHQPIYSDELDCNKIKYHPHHSIPCISNIEVVSGGSLKAGVYQFFAAYSDKEGNPIGQYYPATQPVPIFTKQLTFETNYTTDKAIAITIEGLDSNNLFSYYNLVVAETIDNFTEFKMVETFPLNRNTVIYTGENPSPIKLSSEEVFFKRPFYSTAATVTKANNFLFFGNVNEFSKSNLQTVANQVHLMWETVAISEAVYAKPENTWRYRSNMRDEVYPYGFVFQYDNGEETCAYHIPGRVSSPHDLEIITSNNKDIIEDTSCNNIQRNRRWQVYNTAVVTGQPHEPTENCTDEKCWEFGEMAYWESIERYPNDPIIWGDLCGEPIRHHKFPDSCVTHIHDGLNGHKGFSETNIVYPIGVKVDHESVKIALNNAVIAGTLTQKERDRIVGYRIVRGNRVGHKSIAAKGLIFDMWSYDKNHQKYYYANYPYNSLQNDNFISNTKTTYERANNSSPIPNVFNPTSRYTFHSPDIHFVNSSIGSELNVETEEYGKSEGFFNFCEEEARYRLITAEAGLAILTMGIAAALSSLENKTCVDYTTHAKTVTVGTANYTTSYNYKLFEPYSKTSNLPGGIPKLVSEVKKTTCKGTTFQNLNKASLFGSSNLLEGFVGAFISFNPFPTQTLYFILIAMREMEIMRDLIKSLLPARKMAIQYNSSGIYNNYTCVAKDKGIKNRKIIKHAYLDTDVQLVDEGTNTNITINNWHRESSVFLKLSNEAGMRLPNPTHIDNSRGTMDDFFGHNNATYDKLNERVQRDISAYYVAIKNYKPDQYGDIYNIEYLETNGCIFDLSQTYDQCKHVFGGDTFITRFALKKKMPFFLQSRFRLADDDYVKYSELGNVGYPNYFFNSHETILEKIEDNGLLNTIKRVRDIVGAPITRLDAKVKHALQFEQKGYIHLYNYGIPYFLVESDINTDYRYAENDKEKDFYPHQRHLDTWLQEKNVPIKEDNTYFYNKTYSKQNHESVVCVNGATSDFRECKTAHPNRVIYYDESNQSQTTDTWIISKANNFYDFPLSLGKLISIDGIENEKVLVRFENGVQIFNAFDTLKTGQGADIQVGTGGVFAARPQDFSKTDLGYAGSQHTALISTEFGHIFVDTKRGQVFNLAPNAAGLDDISRNGMKNWFKENLPFQLLKSFPTLQHFDVDNMFKGIGIALAFDKRFDRFFITKRDYKPIKTGIQYDTLNKNFFVRDANQVRTDIELTDKNYFCDKSWTFSYNFLTKSWIPHSWIPNYYIQHIDFFEAGINGSQSSLWSHGLTNKSYQVYFGKLHPFIIETVADKVAGQSILNNIIFDLEAIRYHNEFDVAVNPQITFNKAIIYNSKQCTGLLELIPRDEESLADFGKYPQVTPTGTKIQVTNRQGVWRFNDFSDNVAAQGNNVPIWLYGCDNLSKTLNPQAFRYTDDGSSIRNEQTRVRLQQDKYSQYKLIFKLLDNNENISK